MLSAHGSTTELDAAFLAQVRSCWPIQFFAPVRWLIFPLISTYSFTFRADVFLRLDGR